MSVSDHSLELMRKCTTAGSSENAAISRSMRLVATIPTFCSSCKIARLPRHTAALIRKRSVNFVRQMFWCSSAVAVDGWTSAVQVGCVADPENCSKLSPMRWTSSPQHTLHNLRAAVQDCAMKWGAPQIVYGMHTCSVLDHLHHKAENPLMSRCGTDELLGNG